MRHLKTPKMQEPQEPKFSGTFQTGNAGVTGEIYWTVGAMRGRQCSIVTDPRTGDHPVFMDRKIAERITADLEKLRMEKDEFPDVDRFVVSKLEVGKESKIVRPNVNAGGSSLVIPSSVDIQKYGK